LAPVYIYNFCVLLIYDKYMLIYRSSGLATEIPLSPRSKEASATEMYGKGDWGTIKSDDDDDEGEATRF
jgi:hypothetical protein